jgi:2-oxoglutarate/2-oxoacid ferredoxin oxidoreductase subunit beta
MPNEGSKFNTSIAPTWCPGCGDYGILAALKQALIKQDIAPHELSVVADIGCSGNMADFFKCYLFHSLHGRAIPSAVGIKLANHDLPVLVIIGDGGAYGEGGNHFINLMRGNHDITVLVHNNYIYGLTTGQLSPTTIKGTPTKTTPGGAIEEAFNPIAVALSNHATYVARGYSFDIPQLTDLIVGAMQHRGFSVLDVLQPCITFNRTQTMKWYKEKVARAEQKFATKAEAMAAAMNTERIETGIFWQEEKPAYHEEDPVLKQGTSVARDISQVNISKLIDEFV